MMKMMCRLVVSSLRFYDHDGNEQKKEKHQEQDERMQDSPKPASTTIPYQYCSTTLKLLSQYSSRATVNKKEEYDDSFAFYTSIACRALLHFITDV